MRKGDQDVMAGVYETCLPSHVPPLPEGVSGCFLPSHPPPDVTLFSVGFAPEHLGGAVLDRACVGGGMRGKLSGAASVYTERVDDMRSSGRGVKGGVRMQKCEDLPGVSRCKGQYPGAINQLYPPDAVFPHFPPHTHLPAPPCCW